MSWLNILVIVLALTGGGETLPGGHLLRCLFSLPKLRDALKADLVGLELFDPKEVKHYLGPDSTPVGQHGWQQFSRSLAWRLREYGGLPRMDSPEGRYYTTLYSRDELRKIVARQMKMDVRLNQVMSVTYSPRLLGELSVLLRQQEKLSTIYRAMDGAATGFYWVTAKRIDLGILRAALGDDAFFEGRLPPPLVSVWPPFDLEDP